MPQIMKYHRILSKFAVVTKFLDEDEIKTISSLEKKLMFNRDQFNPKNSGDVATLPVQEAQWLFDKLNPLIGQVNLDHFMYDIDGFDFFQYTKHKKNQECGWHYSCDFPYINWERKICGSIILTPPDEYLGGELEVMGSGDPEEVVPLKPEVGQVVFYAPWMPSRLQKVTSGTRRCLNFWVMGKRGC